MMSHDSENETTHGNNCTERPAKCWHRSSSEEKDDQEEKQQRKSKREEKTSSEHVRTCYTRMAEAAERQLGLADVDNHNKKEN